LFGKSELGETKPSVSFKEIEKIELGNLRAPKIGKNIDKDRVNTEIIRKLLRKQGIEKFYKKFLLKCSLKL